MTPDLVCKALEVLVTVEKCGAEVLTGLESACLNKLPEAKAEELVSLFLSHSAYSTKFYSNKNKPNAKKSLIKISEAFYEQLLLCLELKVTDTNAKSILKVLVEAQNSVYFKRKSLRR